MPLVFVISGAEAPPPPDLHYGVYKQMRMEAREAATKESEDPDTEGRPFKAHTWGGTPLRELKAPVEKKTSEVCIPIDYN